MKISSAFPSKYLKAADLEGRHVLVTMSHVDMENVGDTEPKPVLYFVGKKKGIVLNKTNSNTIAKQFSDDTDTWRGHQIVLFQAMVDFKGETVEAIRCRIPAPNAGAKPQAAATAAPLQPESFVSGLPGPQGEAPPVASHNEFDDEIPF